MIVTIASGALAVAPAAVAALAVVAVGLVAWRWRPAPRRVADAARSSNRGTASGVAPRLIGHGVRVVLVVGAYALWPPSLVLVLGWWLVAPRVRRAREQRRAGEHLARALPDVIDLLVLLVGSGQTVPLAVTTLSRVAPAPLGTALAEVARRRERGQPLADALAALPDQLGPPIRPLTSALVATERYGVALGPTLEQLAVEARRERRRVADIAARKLPVRLSFPLVCCILPAFGLLTVAPLLAGALGSLRV